MSETAYSYIICDFCAARIPKDADYVHGGGGFVRVSGEQTAVPQVDFCCTEHFISWIERQPGVATPDPPYPVPPDPSV